MTRFKIYIYIYILECHIYDHIFIFILKRRKKKRTTTEQLQRRSIQKKHVFKGILQLINHRYGERNHHLHGSRGVKSPSAVWRRDFFLVKVRAQLEMSKTLFLQ